MAARTTAPGTSAPAARLAAVALTLAVVLGASACGGAGEPQAGEASPTTRAGTSEERSPGTTAASTGAEGEPGTSVPASPAETAGPATSAPGPPSTTAPAPTSTTTVTTGDGGVPRQTTTTAPSTPVPAPTPAIPTGGTPEEKAWCTQAKPLAQALNNLFGLSTAQFESLVNQALALKGGAPAATQEHLGRLADVGGRFLVDVKAGRANTSTAGITTWANQHLTPAEQSQFLGSAGAVTSYINRTC